MNSNVALKPNNEDLEALDRAYVFHPSSHIKGHAHGTTPCRIMADGDGITVTDRDGRQSLDAFAGLYCVNVGYGRREIADAVQRQMQELAYYHSYVGHSTEPVIELSGRIIEKAPAGMRRVYYGLSGSDALYYRYCGGDLLVNLYCQCRCFTVGAQPGGPAAQSKGGSGQSALSRTSEGRGG
jgi:4-aminobutyrate aminotransferase-like enzyme